MRDMQRKKNKNKTGDDDVKEQDDQVQMLTPDDLLQDDTASEPSEKPHEQEMLTPDDLLE